MFTASFICANCNSRNNTQRKYAFVWYTLAAARHGSRQVYTRLNEDETGTSMRSQSVGRKKLFRYQTWITLYADGSYNVFVLFWLPGSKVGEQTEEVKTINFAEWDMNHCGLFRSYEQSGCCLSFSRFGGLQSSRCLETHSVICQSRGYKAFNSL